MDASLDIRNQVQTLVDLLRFRAKMMPDKVLYTFLSDNDSTPEDITYAELHQNASAIAAELLEHNCRGERAIVLYPPGIEFICGFFGCLYAGVIAVTAYPPRRNHNLNRLLAIIEDCDAKFVLTIKKTSSTARPLIEDATALPDSRLVWLNTDDIEAAKASLWQPLDIEPDQIAFLQYTSGSTGLPKGVKATHRSLIHNEAQIAEALEVDSDVIFASWLPLYHDLGLIGATLHSLYQGGRSIFMAPAAFIRQPVKWLQAVTDYRANMIAAPNFAYELCAKKITEEQKQGLDLSSLSRVVSGAEMVRAETLDRFSSAFESCGFRRSSFYPVYGLAETMVFVSGGGRHKRPFIKPVSSRALKQHTLEDAQQGSDDITQLVGLGTSRWGSQKLIIVDAQTHRTLPDGKIGEIWIQGDNVSPGYWGNEAVSQEIFHAYTSDTHDGPYLRSGDLGALVDGELFFGGRIKELVVIRGENYYPQDLEKAAVDSHEALQSDSAAAFSIEVEHAESLVLVLEVKRTHRHNLDVDGVARVIRKRIAEQFELEIVSVVFVAPNRMLKTSAGKIQRRAMRESLLEKTLDSLGQSTINKRDFKGVVGDSFSLDRKVLLEASLVNRKGLFLSALKQELSVLSGVAVDTIQDTESLLGLGMDSITIAETAALLRDRLGINITQQALLELDRLDCIADEALTLLPQERGQVDFLSDSSKAIKQANPGSDCVAWPLSYPQQSLWFLAKLESFNSAYNISHAIKLRGPIERESLQRALMLVLQRHEAMRTAFKEEPNGPMQHIVELDDYILVEENLEDLPATAKLAAIQGLAMADSVRPFDLSSGQLLRSRLLRCGMDSKGEPESILILTVHHIAADGWSLNVFQNELSQAYQALVQKRSVELKTLPLQYKDFSVWQRNTLSEDYLEPYLAYWKRQLANVPVLELPTQKRRPAIRSGHGAGFQFVLPENLVKQLKQLAKEQNVSLYMLLLAGFNVLLSRYSGSTDICVGTPIAGRLDQQLQGLIGHFVNTIVVRSDLSRNPTFKDLLAQVKATTLDAYKHQDAPFDRVVEALSVKRDMSYTPLFQVMFAFQNSPLNMQGNNPLGIEALQLDIHSAKFDLTLNIDQQKECFLAEFEYSLDIFDGEYIERLALHFENILRSIVANVDWNLSAMQMLSPIEQTELLVDLNATAGDFSREKTLVELLEQQVEADPNSIALIDKLPTDSNSDCVVEQVTYSELNQRANRLARYLKEQGVGRQSLVGVCSIRNTDLIVALLAVHKAGAAYVPLDPNYPQSRIKLMLDDAQAECVLSHSSVQHCLEASHSKVFCLDKDAYHWLDYDPGNLSLDVSSSDLAYVIYTSGSTGVPKGVEIEHRNAAAMVNWSRSAFSAEELEGVLFGTSICFDLSVWEIFTTLSSGGTLIICENFIELPYLPAQEMKDKVTLINTVPSAVAVLHRLGQIPASVKVVNLAGEALNQTLVNKLYELDHVTKVHDLYGPSEDTTYSTFGLRERNGVANIGRPITNTQAYLLDEWGSLVPKGLPGELYLGGWGVTRGYRNRAELTAQKYLKNPFLDKTKLNAADDDRLYRTGDLARYLPDGTIEYLGRIDHQVKIRGFRIELGEVEATLAEHESVQESLVITQTDDFDETVMVAYIVFKADLQNQPNIKTLQAFVKARLPEYMVPATVVFLDSFPLTPNGKIDRQALPFADLAALGSTDYVAPATDIEMELAKVWESVLGRSHIGVRDDFFALGGHSLMATQIIARIRESFNVELLVKDLFRSPCIAELAGVVSDGSDNMGHLPTTVSFADRSKPIELSSAQKRLWFLDQMESRQSGHSTSNSYNMPGAVRICGKIDLDGFAWAFDELIQRHESLRTNIKIVEGKPYQVVHDGVENFMDLRDLSQEAGHLIEYKVTAYRLEEACRSFDIELNDTAQRTRLIRTRFLKLSDSEHILMVTLHHLIADGWSFNVLLDEVFRLYAAFKESKPNPLPPLSVQYADYSSWQNANIASGEFDGQIDYWKTELSDVPILDLPTDFPRPAVQNFHGSRINFSLPKDLSQQFNIFCQRQGVTLFMGLMSALSIVLQRSADQADFCVGTPIANRTHSALEGLIGCFINPVAIRSRLGDDPTVLEALGRLRDSTLNAYANQDVPFEVLVDELDLAMDLSRSPLFQVMFSLQNAPKSSELISADLEVEVLRNQAQSAKYDFTISMSDDDDQLNGEWEFNTDIFKSETVALYVDHFKQVLMAMIANPELAISKLDMLSDAERAVLTREVASDIGDSPCAVNESLVDLFEDQAAMHPHRVAVTFEDTELSYELLNERANQVARYLIEEGVQPGMLVGLCVDRCLDMIVSVLGILKAGAAYLPIDPTNPAERISYILHDALSEQPVRLVITQNSALSCLSRSKVQAIVLDDEMDLIETQPVENIDDLIITADHTAYIIYTSGTTGNPKGVVITHGNVTRLFSATNRWFDYTQDKQVWTLFHSIAFDFSVWEIWGALLHGGRLLVVPYLTSRSAEDTYNLLLDERVTVLSQTPSAFVQLIQADQRLYPEGAQLSLKHVVFGGEALDFTMLKQWVDKYGLDTPELVNMYGITETTVRVTYHRLALADFEQSSSIIGMPIEDLTTVVLDRQGNPVPLTIPGELHVGGAGLARGYLNLPEVTADRFVANPWRKNTRLYRTGDLVRRLHDGNLEYLGRIDHQVKIRGFRIELGEIHSALLKHSGVQDAVVIVREDQPGDKRIVAYILASSSATAADLKSFARKHLPEYMVPAHIVLMDALPLTSNGKVDMSALERPIGRVDTETTFISPRNEMEQRIADIWQEVLLIAEIGVLDNFFDVGGNSLLATQVISRVRSEFGVDLRLSSLFEQPTIEAIGLGILEAEANDVDDDEMAALLAELGE